MLDSTGYEEARRFVTEMKQKHQTYIPHSNDELYPLEWWNYKFQGENLFCNNNRLFVFLAFKDRFIDGRELKGKTAEIGNKINELLDDISVEKIHTIKYHYDSTSRVGDYSALAISTIYSE